MLSVAASGTEVLASSYRSQICAAIVTYNIGEAIHPCFDSIRNDVGHVVVVDNGSDEVTRNELNRLARSGSVTLILNERNEGLAHAYNQAVHWAQVQGFQWLLTLDHDSAATPGMVDKLLQVYLTLERQGVQNVGVVGPNPFDLNLQRFLMYGPTEGGGLPVAEEEVMSSGSLIQLKVFDAMGPFNEDLFMYHIDTDFCLRLARSGFQVLVCPEAVLLHREGSKERRRFLWGHAYYDRYGKHARYYLTRNLIYMMRRHDLTWRWIYLMVCRICKDHAKILLYDDERFALLWFSVKGLTDGLRGRFGPLNLATRTPLRNA